MGICGAKMKIVAEPVQRGKMPENNKSAKKKQKQNGINQQNQQGVELKNQKKVEKAPKVLPSLKNAKVQSNSKINKEKMEKSNLQSDSYLEANAQYSQNQDPYGIDGSEVFQVQMQRSNLQNDTYGERVNFNGQDYERNGDICCRNQETKRVLTFKKGHIIDRGSYGEVYQCLEVNTGQLYAIKTIRKNKEKAILEKEVQSLAKEIKEYKKLSHKNIVKYIDTELDEDEKGINIILEYVSGGSIRQMLDKFGKFNEKVISIYTNQVLQGLNYLHSNHVFHRDIKGGNILIDTDGTIKLTDFGTLKLHKKDAYINHSKSQSQLSHNQLDYGTIQSQKPFWTAPEVLKNEDSHDAFSDIWSVGCLVIEMITALPPYYNLNDKTSEKEIAKYIMDGNIPNFPENLSEQCLEFLQKTLKANPKERATVNELIQLKFIAEPDQIELTSEQYSPDQVKSGVFQSQTSLGFAQREFHNYKNGLRIQNDFCNDEPPQFMRDAGLFENQNKYQQNKGLNREDKSLIDLNGLSLIQKDKQVKKKTKDNTPLSKNIQQNQQDQNFGDHIHYIENIHQKEEMAFDNQIKRIMLESKQNFNEARDEYQQQLMSQLKEFEDKTQQDQNQQNQNSVKKQEQKDVEDEILDLIKKKKSKKKQGNNAGTNTPQQNKNSSTSTFDTSMQNPPPQIRYQVLFNNPKDNYKFLTQDETIQHNETLLKKQYNDIQQPELDQSPQASKQNPSQNQANPFSKFNSSKQQQEKQEEDQNKIEQKNECIIKNSKLNEYHGQIFQQDIQRISSQDKSLKKVESSEKKLQILQPDPQSLTSLGIGGLDKFQVDPQDQILYNYKVNQTQQKRSGRHQRNKTDQIGQNNNQNEASFFKEVKRDMNGVNKDNLITYSSKEINSDLNLDDAHQSNIQNIHKNAYYNQNNLNNLSRSSLNRKDQRENNSKNIFIENFF
ncbi:hypothetical protein ABPG72_012540 [Tetrahymena utriculariae]